MNSRANYLVTAVVLLFMVPALGWQTGNFLHMRLEKQFHDGMVPSVMTQEQYDSRAMSYMGLCGPGGAAADDPAMDETCSAASGVTFAHRAALATGATGVLLLAVIFGAKLFAGTDRHRMMRVFGPSVRAVMAVMAVSMLAQAALFVYSVFTLESAAIHRVHVFLLLSIGVAAVFGCYALLRTAFSVLQLSPVCIKARELSREDAPGLHALVDQAAKRLGAERPEHIVAGLEPNFFVTAGEVQLPVRGAAPLSGRTLFVSLSLMHLLTDEELTAVIGHELGHFRGGDIEYSRKFAPIYARLGTALAHLKGRSRDGSIPLANLPAAAVLGLFLQTFAEAERTVGRVRELAADAAGAEAASAGALARALAKLSVYGSVWEPVVHKHIEVLEQGRQFTDVAKVFHVFCENLHRELDWETARQELASYVQPHPVDTHPPTAQRLQALGVDPAQLSLGDTALPQAPCINLLADAQAIEQELSSLEAQFLVAIGAAKPPEPQADPAKPADGGEAATV